MKENIPWSHMQETKKWKGKGPRERRGQSLTDRHELCPPRDSVSGIRPAARILSSFHKEIAAGQVLFQAIKKDKRQLGKVQEKKGSTVRKKRKEKEKGRLILDQDSLHHQGCLYVGP